MDFRSVVERAATWVYKHPEDVLGAAKNATALRLTIPLDALRFFVSEIKGKKAPTDVVIEASPPGISLGATINVMKTTLRVTAALSVEDVRIGRGEFRFVARLTNVGLAVIGESDSPVSILIRSGSLDLSKPGKLVAILPKRPLYILEADDDRFVIDLMKDPKLARKLSGVVSRVSPFLTVRGVESSLDALALQLSCLPDGIGSAIDSLKTRV